ncbi:MAG: TetR/AcrR family transcriptional regulator [Fusobacteriaceae bacterium]
MKDKDNNVNVKRILIETTSKMLEEEGLAGISIRKVSARAGYTSGTIYSHFKKFDHLIFLSSLKFLRYYNENIEAYVGTPKNSFEENNLIWNFFCSCSFENPEIFYSIFFSSFEFHKNKMEEYYEIKDFYKFFPENIKEFSSKFYPMLLKLNLEERNKYLLLKLVKDKYISPSHVTMLNLTQIYIYKGYLEKAIKNKNKKDNERIKRSCIRTLKQLYKAYLL